MAVAHDAATEFASTFTTTSPATQNHTPSGTPRGVIVVIGHNSVGTDLITGVTYGGVAMTRVATEADVATEPGRVYTYFLGSGIPTGTQSVSIAHTGTSTVKWAAVATVTAAADTEAGSVVVMQQASPNSVSNPTLFKGERSGLAYQVVYNGALLTNLTLVAGFTDLNIEHQYASASLRFDRETSPTSGPLVSGYTQGTADDLALNVVNIQEVGTGAYIQGAQPTSSTSGQTNFVLRLAGDLADKDLYVHVVSRDTFSGSADLTCTDTSGGNTWVRVNGDTSKQAWVWWKRGTQADVGALLTVASAAGSVTGGTLWVKGGNGAAGNPTTNLTDETNASGDETHAGIDPTDDGAVVIFSVHDTANDTNAVTAISGATMGSLEPEWYERLSTGGSDCRITVTGRTLASGPTGDITWSQTNSTTKSVLFAVAPASTGPNEGTASGAISWVGSASGTSVHSGSASGAIGWAGTVTGDTPANTGSASGAISWVGSVDGETEHEGTVDGAVSWVGSADGATDYSGSASGAITWDGSADGETEHEGTADGDIAWVGTVEGTADHEGTADGAVSWDGTATGVSPAVGVQDGQAIGAIGWDGSATGETNPEGTADGSITWTGTANGVNDPQGAANGTIGWAGTVNGDAPSLVPEGEADGAVGWNGTVNGVSGQPPRLVSMSWPARHAAANTIHPLHLNN